MVSILSSQPPNSVKESKKESNKKLVIIISIIGVAVAVLVGAYFLIQSNNKAQQALRTIPISEGIEDGESKFWSIEGYGSKLEVKLTSQNDDMRVTIVVDGRTIYDKRGWSVDFEVGLDNKYHVIQLVIENPTTFGLGKAILVTGYMRYE